MAGNPVEPILMLHGGAGDAPLLRPAEDYRHALLAALAKGRSILAARGPALEAVQATAEALEDDERFNAGRGSVLNAAGGVEMDAAIMEGAKRRAGAVGGVCEIRNAVRLARAVLDAKAHAFLTGTGAEDFARSVGLEFEPENYFVTDERLRAWRRMQAAAANPDSSEAQAEAIDPLGTIGAVALDCRGDLAAATSTGGTAGKRYGRIGDSPIIGAGTYADNRSCATSCTGDGEFFLRACAAAQIHGRIFFGGADLQTACAESLADVQSLGGRGGLIALGQDGAAVVQATTRRLFWAAWRSGDGAEFADTIPPKSYVFGKNA